MKGNGRVLIKSEPLPERVTVGGWGKARLGLARLEANGAAGYMTPPNRLAMVAETKPEGSQAALGGA